MKDGSHNEIDLLLRKFSRSDRRGSPSSDGSISIEEHLDVDALNAFAENSLPEQARNFYADHLAECEHCRKLVTKLTLASGAVVHQPQVSPLKNSLLQKLFLVASSWLKIQYAVPTFAALAILVAVVIVVRREPKGELVARVDTSSERPSVQITNAPTPAVAAPPETETATAKVSSQPANRQSPEVVPAASGRAAEDERQADAVAAQSPQELDKLQKEEQTKVSEERARVAAAPPPTAVQKPLTEERNAAVSSDVAQAKNEPPERKAKELAGGEDQRTSRRNEEKKTEGAKPAAAPAREMGAASIASRSAARGDLRDRDTGAKDDENTRSVAGHRFRKDGNLWIDVTYRPGAATVSVARGSEQYRALIADEPGIRTIADQLDGEVIVVWKGRAYRIR